MATFEIPLSPQPQTFAITLAGRSLALTVMWRDVDQGGWVLDIADGAGVPLLRGVPLVTGADLLAQYAYLGLGGALYVQTDFDVDAVPAWENLGTTSHLYFVTPD